MQGQATTINGALSQLNAPNPLTIAEQILTWVIIVTIALGCVFACVWFVKKIIGMLAVRKI